MSKYNWGRLRILKYTLGGVGVTGCDFNFVTAANMDEQPIDLGDIVPSNCRVLDIFTVTNNQFTGAVSLGIKIGNATGGEQFAASADVFAANAINQPAVGAGYTLVAISNAAAHVWLSGTPGANWSLNTAGKLTCYITIVDVTGL